MIIEATYCKAMLHRGSLQGRLRICCIGLPRREGSTLTNSIAGFHNKAYYI